MQLGLGLILPLFFVIARMSTFYALNYVKVGKYTLARAIRLMVPFAIGIFTIKRSIRKEEKYLHATQPERYTILATKIVGSAIPIHIVIYAISFGLMAISSDFLPLLRALLVVPYLILASLVVLVGLTTFLWIKKQGTLTIRIISTIVSVASIVFIWWMFHWNWIGSFFS